MKVEYVLLKPENHILKSAEELKSLLKVNSKILVVNDEINVGDKNAEIKIETYYINSSKERMFIVVFENTRECEEKCVKSLEEVTREFRKTIASNGGDIKCDIVWDGISQYYCQKCYPRINAIENLMRKLVFLFMVKNLGGNWYSDGFSTELKNKIDIKFGKNKETKKVINILFEAEFMQLREFMFDKYSRISNFKELFCILKEGKIKSIEEVLELEEKSNWERYFSDVIDEGLNKKWEALSIIRNTVAHNKTMSFSEYEKFINLSNEIETVIINAIAKNDTLNITEEQKVNVFRMLGKELGRMFPVYLQIDNVKTDEHIRSFLDEYCEMLEQDFKMTIGDCSYDNKGETYIETDALLTKAEINIMVDKTDDLAKKHDISISRISYSFS